MNLHYEFWLSKCEIFGELVILYCNYHRNHYQAQHFGFGATLFFRLLFFPFWFAKFKLFNFLHIFLLLYSFIVGQHFLLFHLKTDKNRILPLLCWESHHSDRIPAHRSCAKLCDRPDKTIKGENYFPKGHPGVNNQTTILNSSSASLARACFLKRTSFINNCE